VTLDVPPPWINENTPYITCPWSSGVTSFEPWRMFVEAGSSSAQRSAEEQKLDALNSLKENWDLRGSPPPASAAVAAARDWLQPLREAAHLSGSSWRAPHISASDAGEVTFEWWRGARKITVYFGEGAPEYVKVWGPHIIDQMESSKLKSSDAFRALWLWLNAT
jgi:hypothetical protein